MIKFKIERTPGCTKKKKQRLLENILAPKTQGALQKMGQKDCKPRESRGFL